MKKLINTLLVVFVQALKIPDLEQSGHEFATQFLANLSNQEKLTNIINLKESNDDKNQFDYNNMDKINDYIQELNAENQKRFEQKNKAQPIGQLINNFDFFSNDFMTKINEMNSLAQETKYDFVHDILKTKESESDEAKSEDKESEKTGDDNLANSATAASATAVAEDDGKPVSGETNPKNSTCETGEAMSACKGQPTSRQSEDIKEIAKMMHGQKQVQKTHKKHKKHRKSKKTKKHKKSENDENNLFGNMISVAQIEDEEQPKTEISKITKKINKTLKKVNQDTNSIKSRKIGFGDEAVTLQIIPRFDLSASNVRNFMENSSSFDRQVEKKLINDGVY